MHSWIRPRIFVSACGESVTRKGWPQPWKTAFPKSTFDPEFLFASHDSMTRALLPPEIEQFLLERILTHEQLQVAIWLSRHPEESVSVERLAGELSLSVGETQDAVLGLVDAELVARSSEGPTRYWYAPAHPTLHTQMRFVTVLQEHYRADLLRSMALNAVARLRRAAQLACLVTLSADVRRALIRRPNDDAPPSSRRVRSNVFAFLPT